MRIGEITKKYGVSCRRIRHYEEMGLLPCAREEPSNYRVYDKAACDRLEIIKLLRELGFSLREIKLTIEQPASNRTQELFLKKSAEIEHDISAMSNRAQILGAAARIIGGQGFDMLDLAAVIRECVYIHSKNERMISMDVTNEKILLEIGYELIPIVEGENSLILSGIRELRQILEKELNITVPLIRIRDSANLDPLAMTISIDGKQKCSRSYSECRGKETSDDMLSLLASCIRDNIGLL